MHNFLKRAQNALTHIHRLLGWLEWDKKYLDVLSTQFIDLHFVALESTQTKKKRFEEKKKSAQSDQDITAHTGIQMRTR